MSGPLLTLPDDHDCDECGCVLPEFGWHQTIGGECLGCGGCGDPECCGGHDDSCRFAPRELAQAE
jgi:hypothetical protein